LYTANQRFYEYCKNTVYRDKRKPLCAEITQVHGGCASKALAGRCPQHGPVGCRRGDGLSSIQPPRAGQSEGPGADAGRAAGRTGTLLAPYLAPAAKNARNYRREKFF